MNEDTVVLLRVSSNMQDNEAQRHACLEYCKEHNLHVLQILESKESAFKNTMDDLQNIQTILNYAEQGLISNLVFFKADRVGRSISFISFFEKMNDFQIKVHSVVEGVLECKDSMDMLQMVLRLFAGQQEGESTSIRVKNAIKTYNEQTYVDENGEIIEAFIGGSVPYGCEIVDTGIVRNNKRGTTVKKLQLVEEEAKVVRLIFDKYLYEDYGTVKIARWLNDNKIPTKRGKKWKNVTVLGILTNPVYTGKLRYHMVEFVSPKSKKIKKLDASEWKYKEMEHLRIVTDEEFIKTQSLSKERSTRLNSEVVRCSDNVLLNGLVYCGYCGAKLQVSSNKRKNKTVGEYRSYLYNCRGGMHDDAHLRKTYPAHVVDTEFETNIIDVIKNQVLNEINLDLNLSEHQASIVDKIKSEINRLEKELHDKESELESLEGEVAKAVAGKSDFSPKLLAKLIDNIEKDISEMKSQLLSKRSELKTIEMNANQQIERMAIFKDFEKLYKEAPTLQSRKLLIRSIVSKVVLRKGEMDIILELHK